MKVSKDDLPYVQGPNAAPILTRNYLAFNKKQSTVSIFNLLNKKSYEIKVGNDEEIEIFVEN